MNISTQFMAVYLFAWRAHSPSQLTEQKTAQSEEGCEQAAHTATVGPMLCIPSPGARMRALQMDPINEVPQHRAQEWIYMRAYALLVDTLLAILAPLVMNGETKLDGKGLGDVEFAMMRTALTALRYVVMPSIYGGFIAVTYAIFTIQHRRSTRRCSAGST